MSIQNEILNAIASRRSCRAYKPERYGRNTMDSAADGEMTEE